MPHPHKGKIQENRNLGTRKSPCCLDPRLPSIYFVGNIFLLPVSSRLWYCYCSRKRPNLPFTTAPQVPPMVPPLRSLLLCMSLWPHGLHSECPHYSYTQDASVGSAQCLCSETLWGRCHWLYIMPFSSNQRDRVKELSQYWIQTKTDPVQKGSLGLEWKE